MTLLELRKRASELGIQNYSEFTKAQLIEEIEKIEKGEVEAATSNEENLEGGETESVSSETDNSEEDEKAVQEKIEKGEVEEITAEEAEKLGPDQKLKKTKKFTKEKKAKTKRTKKQKGPKVKTKAIYKFTPKGPKPEKLGPTAEKVYDELMKNTGLSMYHIAKNCGTYFSVVSTVVSKYFEMTKEVETINEVEEIVEV